MKYRVASRKSSTETSREGSSLKTNLQRERRRVLTGGHVSWMIYKYFKVSDTDESAVDLNVKHFSSRERQPKGQCSVKSVECNTTQGVSPRDRERVHGPDLQEGTSGVKEAKGRVFES